MSNENENPTPPAGEEEGKAPETGAEQAPAQEQAAEAPKEEAAAGETGLNKWVAMLTELREKNPKAFYGGIAGAVVLLLLILKLMGGGGVEQAKTVTVQVGQTYQLVNPNVTDGGDVLLFQAPGRMGATDPEIREKEKVCVVDAGTRAKVLEESIINYVRYVKVEPMEGDCAGKQGWTSVVNLK